MREDEKIRGVAAFNRGLDLLEALTTENSPARLSDICRTLGLPQSTGRRLAALLERRAYIARRGRGEYGPGLSLLRPGWRFAQADMLASLSRPIARRLSKQLDLTVHIGVFEHDMITYLVKASADPRAVFTREGMQLEAYCTAIGKMLLATMEEGDREAYLRGGPFVSLTANTITDVAALRVHLGDVRAAGMATESEETQPGLACMAVPILGHNETPFAALSASWLAPRTQPSGLRESLDRAAGQISAAVAPYYAASPAG